MNRSFAPTAATILASSLLAGFGCQQEKPSAPASENGAHPQAAAPTSQPSSASAAHALPDAGKPFSGTIEVEEGVEIAASDVLFVMARKSQGGGMAGQLVAVKRMTGLERGSFPARFELSGTDTMVKGTPFMGPFIVYARLDRDGDPMTKTEDDLYAAITEPVANGAADLKMVLKKGAPKTVPSAPAHGAPKAPHGAMAPHGAASQPATH